jgi:chromosomal replication initiator protein
MQERWQEVLGYAQGEVRAFEFRNWFKPLKPVHWHNGTVTVQVKDAAFQEWFVERYEPVLLRSLEEVMEKPMTVEYKVVDRPLFEAQVVPAAPAPAASALGVDYIFDNFIVGPSNHMAFAAGKAVAERSGRAYNPLFIFGGTGLGKTHLLHAIGHYAHQRDPRLRVLYITAETYFHDMTTSIRTQNMEQFRVKYRDACDVLLVDDVQFLAGKPRTQEEFFHTFNALHAAGKQIAFSSDRFPQELPGLEDRLRSRFEWGLIAEIAAPELETRVAILRAKAERMGMALDDDVALLIAKQVRDNIRELESCLKTLHLVTATTGEQVTPALAQERLKSYFRSRIRRVNVDQIIRQVGHRYGVSEEEIKSRSRKKTIAAPRHVAMYLARRLTVHSFPELGERFGGRDHSSVMSATRKIDKQRRIDATLQQTIDEFEHKLRR